MSNKIWWFLISSIVLLLIAIYFNFIPNFSPENTRESEIKSCPANTFQCKSYNGKVNICCPGEKGTDFKCFNNIVVRDIVACEPIKDESCKALGSNFKFCDKDRGPDLCCPEKWTCYQNIFGYAACKHPNIDNCKGAGLVKCGNYACCQPKPQQMCVQSRYCSTPKEACEGKDDGSTFCGGSVFNSCCKKDQICVTAGSIPNCIKKPTTTE